MKILLLFVSLVITAVNTCNENSKSNSSDKKENSADQQGEIKSNENTYFKFIDAFSEYWVAGIPDGGSGTEYYFNVKIISADKINFDSAWVDNKVFPVYIRNQSATITGQPVNFGTGDTITVRVSHKKDKDKDKIIVTHPLQHNGAALISYTVNNQKNYFTVPEIKKLKQVNRP